jgi:hypothetical protein
VNWWSREECEDEVLHGKDIWKKWLQNNCGILLAGNDTGAR